VIAVGSLDYAQARMQSRLGRRPSEPVWSAIEHAREFEAVIDLARGTTLAEALHDLGEAREVHAVEGRLRLHWRATVEEAALWMPGRWRAALRWCAVLPDLPALHHAASGRAAYDWMRADPIYRELVDEDGVRVPADHALAPLAAALTAPRELARAWGREWLRRAGLSDDQLEGLVPIRRLLAYRLVPAKVVAEAGQVRVRRDLDAGLLAAFRRHAIEPLAAFAYVGLVALDLERLRGEVTRRLAMPTRSFAS